MRYSVVILLLRVLRRILERQWEIRHALKIPADYNDQDLYDSIDRNIAIEQTYIEAFKATQSHNDTCDNR